MCVCVCPHVGSQNNLWGSVLSFQRLSPGHKLGSSSLGPSTCLAIPLDLFIPFGGEKSYLCVHVCACFYSVCVCMVCACVREMEARRQNIRFSIHCHPPYLFIYLLKFLLYYFILYVCVFGLPMCVHHVYARCPPQRPEEGAGSPGTGVQGSCKTPHVLGTESSCSARAASVPTYWTISPALFLVFVCFLFGDKVFYWF